MDILIAVVDLALSLLPNVTWKRLKEYTHKKIKNKVNKCLLWFRYSKYINMSPFEKREHIVLHLSVGLSVSLSVCLYVSPSVCLSVGW